MRVVHWFRNDLRLRDNRALESAAAVATALVPVFVFDPRLLRGNWFSVPRLRFLFGCLRSLARDLEAAGCPLIVRRGDPRVEIPRLLEEVSADVLSMNRDYSPYAVRRDEDVASAAGRLGVTVSDHKDRVFFESSEIRTKAGKPFLVFTPYARAWRRRLSETQLARPARRRLPPGIEGLRRGDLEGDGDVSVAGDTTDIPTAGEAAGRRRLSLFVSRGLREYGRCRDLPAVDGTSRLSPHLRFGTISVRECVRAAQRSAQTAATREGAEKWLNELVWRDFFHAFLAEHPDVLRRSFRQEYRDVQWNDDEKGFQAWCEGCTGYPFVDAAMRQLRSEGWMHNRARMVVASFLVKDLLVDWRKGEAHFMRHLVDGEPAANNGGWQWAASTGADAQPYFRIFNPVTQGERFDPGGQYVRRYVPELRSVPDRFVHHPWSAPTPPRDYPPPIVDHAERRIVALARFEAARRGF